MPEDKTQLTVNDPISSEELVRLNELDKVRTGLAQRNLLLDQEKIGILAAIKRIEGETRTIFERVLSERGLPPETEVDIDPKTGALSVLSSQRPESSESAQEG